jgi:Rel homology DNA-binding domain
LFSTIPVAVGASEDSTKQVIFPDTGVTSVIAVSFSQFDTRQPSVLILEQPASRDLRFRYECEGRSAGSIHGENNNSDRKTYPTIQVVGYKGRAVVVVSCVTKDAPYRLVSDQAVIYCQCNNIIVFRPHPYSLVGQEGCAQGVCTLEINTDDMIIVFGNLGIQCVKRRDIENALIVREEIRVDPFRSESGTVLFSKLVFIVNIVALTNWFCI